jgi:hypothetical protein
MKLQYMHKRDSYYLADFNSHTVVVEQPTRSDLLLVEEEFKKWGKAKLEISIGVTWFNPKDKHWVKRIGREMALCLKRIR